MWAFVSYAGGWSFAVKGLALVMLLAGGTLAAMPVGLFLSGRPKPAGRPAGVGKADPSDTQASPAVESSESVAVADDESSFDMAAAGHDSEEFAEAVAGPDLRSRLRRFRTRGQVATRQRR